MCGRTSVLAVALATSACAAPTQDVDEVSARIDAGDYDTVTIDGLHLIVGPDCVLDYIRREAVAGKSGLSRHLASDVKHVRYFGLLALDRIGDVESRRILRRWVEEHGDRDPSFALLIHAHLVRQNDYSQARRFLGLEPDRVDRFALGTWLAVAQHHLGLTHAGLLSSEEDSRRALRRIDDHLSRMLYAFPFLKR